MCLHQNEAEYGNKKLRKVSTGFISRIKIFLILKIRETSIIIDNTG